MRVLFGHQSVGQNLLDGVRDLAASGESVPALLDPEDLPAEPGADCIAAFRAGRNHEPASKLAHFAERLLGESGRRTDLALLKFCYVDLDAGTDVAALFAHYRRQTEAWQAALPGVVIGQVTVPLRALSSGFVARIRGVFGRYHRQVLANAARERFNDLLRAHYGPRGTLFDLAAIESRAPDGRSRMHAAPGGRVRALAREYTLDGGHLNVAGRVVAARAFLAYLAKMQPMART